MRTGNIMAFEKAPALPRPSTNTVKGNSFQDLLGEKLSEKEPIRKKESRQDYEKLRKNKEKESLEKPSKDQEKLVATDQEVSNKKMKTDKKEISLEKLQELLSSEELENLENPEELKALLAKISELGEELKEILGELVDQGVIDESLMEGIEALLNMDISLDEYSGDEAKILEKLDQLLQGVKETLEKIPKSRDAEKLLENLEKVEEEMSMLLKEAINKASAMKNKVDESALKDLESQEIAPENKASKKEKDSNTSKDAVAGEEKSSEKNGKIQEQMSLNNKDVKEETTLTEKESTKEKSLKEEKSSKVSLTVETKEEPVLERNFLFNQGKTESLEKLSTILTKNPEGFEQNLSQMIEEMTEKISIMKNGEASAIKMQLVPNNLGKLMIELSTDENILSAKVYADTPKVKEMIESQLQELKEALVDKGLTVESLEVFVGQEQDRALYQKHGPMMMTGRNRSSQISFGEMEAIEEAALKSNPYVEKYQYNRLV